MGASIGYSSLKAGDGGDMNGRARACTALLVLVLALATAGCASIREEPKTLADFQERCAADGHEPGSWAWQHCSTRRAALHAAPLLSDQAIAAMVSIQSNWRECDRAARSYDLTFAVDDYRDREAVTSSWNKLLDDLDNEDRDVARNWSSVLDELYESALPTLIAREGEERGWKEFGERMDTLIEALELAGRQEKAAACHRRAVEAYQDWGPVFLQYR